MQFPNGHFVFLDLETTGGKASQDRITEVGLIEVFDGEVVDQYQTLVNPEVPISRFITSLTGIDDAMVATAPTFSDIAEDLLARLANKTLVAHNARFDHSFLKNEFRRLGYDYRTKVLCTVKLSRALMPQLSSHSLDNLIHVHGLWVENRHRAMGDADLLVQLMSRWSNNFGPEKIQAINQQHLRVASLPPQLNRKIVDKLPNAPGVYLFYDHQNTLLYVGKSIKIRERVKSHFANDHASDKELAIAQQVHRIETQLTGGDLGAQLLEMQLIKERQPIYNQQLRRTKLLWYFLLQPDKKGYLSLQLKSGNNLTPDELPDVIGLFRSKRMAETVLQRAVKDNQLCHRLTGLEKSRKGACFAHQLRQCLGACVGKEDVAIYNERLKDTFGQWLFKLWPYDGAVIVEESYQPATQTKGSKKKNTIDQQLTQYHLIDRWCHLKSSHYLSDLFTDKLFADRLPAGKLPADKSPADAAPDNKKPYNKPKTSKADREGSINLEFEYDTYKLLTKWLFKNKANIIPVDNLRAPKQANAT